MPRTSVWDDRQPIAPVTLPRVAWLDKATNDDAVERKEAARKFAEARIIKAGAEAWMAINRAESFSGWLAIGQALQVGRNHAMKVTGANRPEGQTYCKAFSSWIEQHGFKKMAKSVRSVAVALAENAPAIEAWRATLPEKQRRRLVHPLSNVRRWRAATAHDNGKGPQDLQRDAMAA